jgi:hypothetical protein
VSTAFNDVKPWPTAKAPPEAVGSQPGHNRPPLDIEARAAFDETIDQKDGFRARVASLIGSADRAVATDEESTGRCGELVKQIRAAVTYIEGAHKTAKEPYLLAGRVVDAAKNEMVTPLDAAKRMVEAKQTQFLREENARREMEARRQREAEAVRLREEADRAAEEAKKRGMITEETVAIAAEDLNRHLPPIEPERTFIRGDYGAAVSGTKTWLSQIEDYEVAFIAVANNAKVREAIDKAVAAMVKAGVHEIAGVRIWSDVKASNR